MDRRSYLVAVGGTVSTLLAGCLNNGSNSSDSNDSQNSDNGNGSNLNETGTTDDESGSNPNDDATDNASNSEAIDAVEAYIQAGKNASVEAAMEAVHEDSPLMSFLEEGETNFEDDGIDAEIVGHEIIKEDVNATDVLELRYAETIFQDESELVNLLDGEDAVLLDVSFDPAPTAVREDTWVVLTEGSGWKVFWATEETPEEPNEQFEPEITDENQDVVAEVDWDPEIDSPGEWVQVQLTEDPGIEADVVRIESTVAGAEFSFSGGSEGSWAGSWANVNLNSTGDQIVVTVITDEDVTVVHRVHYDP